MFGINDQLKRLERENTPIRISLIGAGSMGATFLDQVMMAPGMEIDVVVDINIQNATDALKTAGVDERTIAICNSVEEAEKALKNKKRVCSTNPELAWGIKSIQVLVEATGAPAPFAQPVGCGDQLP